MGQTSKGSSKAAKHQRTTSRFQGFSVALIALAAVLLGAPVQASYLGLVPGDEIETIGFTVPVTGAVFTDAADTLSVDGVATNIDLIVPSPPLTEINGGIIDVNLSLQSESLSSLGGTFFSYTASFDGDISLYAPTGGPAPEQDGRLLITGDINAPMTITIAFDTLASFTPTPSVAGDFTVTGGDATFQQAFGATGSLAELLASMFSVDPTIDTLLADGWLFSVRDPADLATCAAGGFGTICSSSVIDQSGDYTSAASGLISPLEGAPFVPEPNTFTLVAGGLVGLLGWRRTARR